MSTSIPEEENPNALTEDNIPVATVQSALSYQITKYGLLSATNSQSCLACMANSIVDHLNTLLSHKSIINNQSLRLVYSDMLMDWKRIKVIHSQKYTGGHHPTHLH